MIRDLRKKFILVAMLSTMLVLTAIMGVVNFSNYREMLDRADEMTALLEQNDGKFPEEPSWHEQDDTETPPAKPENDEKDKSRFSVETPFETRYFTVTVDENGEVTDCDLDRIAAVDEETAEEYTQTAQQKNKTTGFQGIYRYRVTETEDGAKYVFLDCRREISNFRTVLVTTISVSLLGLAAVFVLVVIFSRMVFRAGGREYPETETLYHRREPRAQDTTDDHRCKHRGHGNGKRRIPVDKEHPETDPAAFRTGPAARDIEQARRGKRTGRKMRIQSFRSCVRMCTALRITGTDP